MVAHPLPSMSRVSAGENVETGFKPLGKTVRYLDRLMQGVVGRDCAVVRPFRSLKSKIAVQFDHSGALLHRLRGVHLDLIILLTPQRYGDDRQEQGCKNKAAFNH